jgi:hypothetical protein
MVFTDGLKIIQGILIEREFFSTVDLLIKVIPFAKNVNNIFDTERS